TLTYEGDPYTTPFTIPMIVNARRSIGAPLVQDGLPFAYWSDGGAATHEIVGKATAQTLTATYGYITFLPVIVRGTAP
ncbi:MAG: hypothetical protein JXC32_11365, partial [Anaerolineae bacterium]|nr:hypothetical protein [Anaerolineae bacterium]